MLVGALKHERVGQFQQLHFELLREHGALLLGLGRHRAAVEALTDALGLRDGDVKSLRLRGRALLALQRYTMASQMDVTVQTCCTRKRRAEGTRSIRPAIARRLYGRGAYACSLPTEATR